MNTLLAGVTLLILGDSHVAFKDSLLSVLPEAYESMGAKVVTYGVCSSSPAGWVKGPKDTGCGGVVRNGTGPIADPSAATFPFPDVASLIDKWQPTAVMFIYGDTIGSYTADPFPAEWIENQVKPVAALAGAKTKCLWVGPTWGTFNPRYGKTEETTKRITGFLSSHVQPCTYIDSTSFMQNKAVETVDGLHLTPKSYKAWGAGIVDATLPLLSGNGSKS
ncbi:Uncharacterised protein [Cedecea davisae]|uniref:BcsX family protein n=1 Tax=Cedecea davisae DSM 4568 TaxID=566551 RepID=S3IUU7_9ENTR|nr:BcsX family protein [Cedecea davisae]EPF16356.1 BcsX family protein [Cedecea davisae DSM 4568]SUX38866.1 Uncharacterised protein [Cedecea davisae]